MEAVEPGGPPLVSIDVGREEYTTNSETLAIVVAVAGPKRTLSRN